MKIGLFKGIFRGKDPGPVKVGGFAQSGGSGGGSSNEPTFQSTSYSMSNIDESIEVNITNDGDTPIAVEL